MRWPDSEWATGYQPVLCVWGGGGGGGRAGVVVVVVL